MQITNNINKDRFVEVTRAKARLKWVQKRLGRKKLETVEIEATFKEFCFKEEKQDDS